MRFQNCVLFFIAIVLFQSATAQKVSDNNIIKQLKIDINYLASDELKGRRTGSEGEQMAADHIIKYYNTTGVKGYEGKFKYPFTFTVGREIAKTTRLNINNAGLELPDDGFPLAFSGNGVIEQKQVNPYTKEKGKVWMLPMFKDAEQADDPHFNWEKEAYSICEEAIKNGAGGVIFYDQYGAKYPATFNSKTEYETLSIPVVYTSNNAYLRYINRGNSEVVPPFFADMTVMLKEKKLTGNNILGYVDNNADYTVVIGAHYDHLGLGEDGNSLHAPKDGAVHNGADDNASGSAALMQFASWINKSNLKKYNYLFMHFSAEELGLIGSKKVVEQLGLSGDKVAYMINMDMVGRLNEGTHALTVGGIGTSPAWGKAVDLKTPDFKIVVDSSGVGPSDHSSFYHKNIPVLFFFTGTHKDYHKPSDDADKINYEGEAMIMRYIYSIVTKMETMPKPAFTKTKQKTVGKVRFKVTLGVMPDYSFNDGGLKIDGVTEGRPAGVAGLKAGDIVTQLGEHKVRGIQTYMEALGKFEVGDKTQVTVKRGDKELTFPLTFTPKK